MVDDRHPERISVAHGLAHHARVHDRQAVIGNGDRSGAFHGADLRQLLALAAFGDGADRENIDRGIAAGAFHDETRHRRAVVDRNRVRHAADGGESTRRRCPGAALNRFGVLDARFPQVDVNIDKPRRYNVPGGVENLGFADFETRLHGSDQPVLDEHIALRVKTRFRVDYAAVFDQQTTHMALETDRGKRALGAACRQRSSETETVISTPRTPARAPPCAPPRRFRPDAGSPSAGSRPLPRKAPSPD